MPYNKSFIDQASSVKMAGYWRWFFFFKQKTAYEIGVRLVGSEMCIRDSLRTCLFLSPENAKVMAHALIII